MVRVLIVSAHPVLAEGLSRLLTGNPEVEVVEQEADLDAAMASLERPRPDVVVVESSRHPGAEMEAVQRICRRWPGVRVLCVDLADNTVCTYRGEHRTVQSLTDFLQALGLGHDMAATC